MILDWHNLAASWRESPVRLQAARVRLAELRSCDQGGRELESCTSQNVYADFQRTVASQSFGSYFLTVASLYFFSANCAV